MTRNSSRVGPRALVAALVTALVASFVLATSSSAQAAPGDPFDPSSQLIFASKGDGPGQPTTLFSLDENGGSYAFAALGPAAPISYNALAFNGDDNYLYAIVTGDGNNDFSPGDLIRIGEAGAITYISTPGVPDSQNVGAWDPATGFYYTMFNQGSNISVIDLNPGPDYGTLVDTVVTDGDHGAGDPPGGGSDFAFSNGFLWSLGPGGIYRIDLDSGAVDNWPTPAGAGSSAGTSNETAGAAWTFLGDDLGFSYNTSGQVVRIAVTNPDADTPTFTTVSNKAGEGSASNDGAAIPGNGADLELTKEAELSDDESQVTYTLTVTNNGGSDSSGWTVEDTLPDGLSNPVVTGAGSATVSGSDITVEGGELTAGSSAVITVVADVDDGFSGELENTASVTGNEVDPDPSNNEDTATVEVPGDPDDPAAPDTGIERESMVLTYAALTSGLLMLLALLVWRGVAARRE